MKKNLDVMSLAHKIFKDNERFTRFGSALKLAWLICRNAKILVQENIIKIYSSILNQYNLSVENRRERNCIVIKNNIYDLNLFAYEAKYILA